MRLAGFYEHAPAVKNLMGEEDTGSIQGFDISIEYQIL